MQFRMLGPLEVLDGGREIAVGGGKQRALLAVLLLHANEVVPSERLIDELWGEAAPATATKSVQLYVSHLRKALRSDHPDNNEEDRLLTRSGGYILRLDVGQLDLHRFERERADGHRALAAGRPARAAQILREALELWRGPALVDFSYEPFAQTPIARLEELRLGALEDRVDADLALGRHADLLAELETLVAQQPLRERMRGQLMLALYRCDRQPEALDVYRDGRRRLIDDLGLEPGPNLQYLEQAILTRSADLRAPAATAELGAGRGLPAPPNRTVGRELELAVIADRLRTRSVRLLTLTGPGGVGKTRIALEAGRAAEGEFGDGACFVSLAAIQRPSQVPAEVVGALGIVLLSGESAAAAVGRFLAAKHLLLVVDNFEHVLGAAPLIGELLATSPGVTVLATSREPLALKAEACYPVSPLALPDGTEDVAALACVPAVALFTERARAHDPGFELDDGAAVAEICRRVDGLPLAIELAAARCALLSPSEIAERLDEALGSGARDAPERQQTLRATIEWSHSLLTDTEQECFARIAVFAGGAPVRAAERITGADLDTLDHLVSKNLLVRRRHPGTVTRLTMLETIRAYAAERLTGAEDHEAVCERHYCWFLALAQRHGSDQALLGASRSEHLARLDADADNLDAALGWAVGKSDAERVLKLCAALGCYWEMRDRNADAVVWSDRALTLAGEAYPALRALILSRKAGFLWRVGRVTDQGAVMAEAEAIARVLAEPGLLSRVLVKRARIETGAGRFEIAAELADDALHWARLSGEEWEIAEALRVRAPIVSTVAELRERVDRAAELLGRVGNNYGLAHLLGTAGYTALCLGSDRDALELEGRAASLIRDLDDTSMWMFVRGNAGMAELLTGDTLAAENAFNEELRLCRQLAVPPFASEGLLGLAAIAVHRGRADRAARLRGAASAHGYGQPQVEIEERLTALYFEPARTRYGDDAWHAAVEEGATMSFEHAIAYALEEERA